jgi:hypothetical protein
MKSLAAKCVVALAWLAPGLAQTPPQQGSSQPAPADSVIQSNPLPVEVAGYLSFRTLREDDLEQGAAYREYAGSLFLSKTLNRWRFHAEFNASTASEYDSDGIHLFRPRPSLSVKLDSGFVNYTISDSLQVEAGFLFIPTYWREHRYQSTTLTVDDPFQDQNVFPTAFKGAMVHGERYFGEGGISYMLYGGVDQQSEFPTQFPAQGEVLRNERARALGGKVVGHLPSGHFFDTFDLGIHVLLRYPSNNDRDDVYGTELLLRKQRVEVLGEFAHASLDIAQGSRAYIRQGLYIQPSYRLAKGLFAVARYDRLNRDSRITDESSQARQSAGLTFRPIPAISLKLEADRYEPQAGKRAYYGMTTGVVYFFHKP